MTQTVEQYWADQVKASCSSLYVESEVEPYGNRGNITAEAWFPDDAFLKIAESVTVHANGYVSRDSYSYHFQIDGSDYQRWCYNPLLESEIQRHIDLPGQHHMPDRRWTFQEIVEECWQLFAASLDESDQLDA